MEVVAKYLEMYKECMWRKKYAQFKQQLFQHIEEYMEEGSMQCSLWKTVVSRVKETVSNLEQRIVISTIAYHVDDLLTEMVKDF